MDRITGAVFWLAVLAGAVAFFQWSEKRPDNPVSRLVVGLISIFFGLLFAWVGATQLHPILGALACLYFFVIGIKEWKRK